MERQTYAIQWINHDVGRPAGHLLQSQQLQDIMENGDGGEDCEGEEYMMDEDGGMPTEAELDQIAAENLIFMASDGQVTQFITTCTDDQGRVLISRTEDGKTIDCGGGGAELMLDGIIGQHGEHMAGSYEDFAETTPQMVTEEVITDDWVQHQGEERVEIPAEQILGSNSQLLLDSEVPLPTVQDEYTALRPYPCDFCSRRFRKKATLMSHMVAHQNDRAYLCKLCGARFVRRSELLNHFKAHAEGSDVQLDNHFFESPAEATQQRAANDHYYEQEWSVHYEGTSEQPAKKAAGKSTNASGNSSTASSNAPKTTPRGRTSRLKPKEEVFCHDEEPQPEMAEPALPEQTDFKVKYEESFPKITAVQTKQEPETDNDSNAKFPVIDEGKPFVCQQCGLSFSREKALLAHAKNHRNDAPHECSQCNEIFGDMASLEEHQKTHEFEESNSEYDPEDTEETLSESESENLYGEYYCSECGISFHRRDLLRRHSKTHEKNATHPAPPLEVSSETAVNGRHCCNTCGETFAEALDLLAHAEIHARFPPHKCLLCGETFFEDETIKRHMLAQHGSEMTNNSCILCGKACRDRKALIKHAWDHSREKCHSCSKCAKSFHNKARLKRHMASHRDKSVVCDVCHEEFPDGRTLSNHRHSHTNASGKLFPCHECGKTFGSRSSQQIHVRIHTGERPYGCRFCWKAFADGGTLRKHERIHTGEKPYACSVCPRAFNQRVVLREHIRSHHSGIDSKLGKYFCAVCSTEQPSSAELIQHLVQHSDLNTALQRQPVTGPRKYKRRRKLKPHEIANLRTEKTENGENASDIDFSDIDMENVDDFLNLAETPTATPTKSQTPRSSKREAARATAVAVDERATKTKSKSRSNNKRSVSSAGGRHTKETTTTTTTATTTTTPTKTTADAKASQQLQNLYQRQVDKCGDQGSWQTKLLNSKSLLSNLENTLQSIDALVVSNNNNNHNNNNHNSSSHNGKSYDVDEGVEEGENVNIIVNDYVEFAAQKRLQTEKAATTSAKSRKKAPATPATRPKMIFTKRTRATEDSGESGKRRGKGFVTRTQSENMELLAKSSSTMVDDYEIISPALQPPNQISCSPLHIKQEHEQQTHQQQLQHQQQIQDNGGHGKIGPSSQMSVRNAEMYDAQLLLEASTLRKSAYEKFNPSIVNDLEEILRSPSKAERCRFTSESSSTGQFLACEPPEEEEQHLIKIEPTSPSLQEIVASNVNVTMNGGSGSVGDVDVCGSSNRAERRSTRSTRSRKFLQFEDSAPKAALPIPEASATPVRVLNCAEIEKKVIKLVQPQLEKSPSFFDYSGNSLSSISSVVSAADASAAAAAVAAASGAPSAGAGRRTRFYECEMCFAVFADRAQLLDHVPIHI